MEMLLSDNVPNLNLAAKIATFPIEGGIDWFLLVKMRPDRTKKMIMLGRMMLLVLLPGCRIMKIVNCIICLLYTSRCV